MGIVLLFGWIEFYVLPVIALLSWIFRYTIVVRENEQGGRNTTFAGVVKDTLGQCYGFYVILVFYLLGILILVDDIGSAIRWLFMSKGIPAGYLTLGCIFVGLVYSFLFYKRHSSNK